MHCVLCWIMQNWMYLQVIDWLNNHGDIFLQKNTSVGRSLNRAKTLQKSHEHFEAVAQVSAALICWFCWRCGLVRRGLFALILFALCTARLALIGWYYLHSALQDWLWLADTIYTLQCKTGSGWLTHSAVQDWLADSVVYQAGSDVWKFVFFLSL